MRVSDLERRLAQLGAELDWPATPELATAVRARLEAAAPPRRRPVVRLRRPLVLALLGLLLLAGGVFAAVPGVRDAVLELLGLQGATVERREELPSAGELNDLQLGERTTLDDAREALGFDPVVPRAVGEPDGVFVNRTVPGGELSLAYVAGPGLPEASSTDLGLLVSQFRGDLMPEYVGKIAGQATTIEELEVDGDRAIWLEGAPHVFFYRPPGEPFRDHVLRIAENVLLVEHDGLLVRFEGAFTRERALALARSVE